MKEPTPGPWTTRPWSVTKGVVSEVVIDSPRWREMAVVNVQEDDTTEHADLGCGVLNARLMAAAPDLLAALEAFVKAAGPRAHRLGCECDLECKQRLARVVDAIAKARGEP